MLVIVLCVGSVNMTDNWWSLSKMHSLNISGWIQWFIRPILCIFAKVGKSMKILNSR